jgi:mannose/fructose-specific phosphotransferase system component IIA
MGLNLPMLIKLSSMVKEDKNVGDVASFIASYGKDKIQSASDLLKGSQGEK